MSEATKFPFESIPLDGGATTTAEPRPAFSRSVPDLSTAGLLPPTRKPVAVTVPEPTPPVTPPAEPNPMASTPPPKAGSLRGLVWDLVRPTRTKWAILAGGVSLAAGAYGLNLFMPTPNAPPKKQESETAKFAGTPQVIDERPPPSVNEQRVAPVVPVAPKDPVPSPLPALSGSNSADPPKPIIPVRADVLTDPIPAPSPSPVPLKPELKEPVPTPLPPVDDRPKITPVPAPAVDLTPKPLALPPLPPVSDKPDPGKLVPLPGPGPLPHVKSDDPKPGAIPVPKFDEQSNTLPKPVMPAGSEKPADPDTLQKPKPLSIENPDLLKKVEPAPVEAKLIPSPIPAPVEAKPIPSPVPAPDVKFAPVGDTKPLPAVTPLPPVGEVVNLPKTDKPAEPAPIPKPLLPDVKPVEATPIPKPGEAVPIPKPVGGEPLPTTVPVRADPIPSPLKEEKPAVIPFPASGGAKDPPPVSVSESPAKKGFEVDVVKVRATDTYTSISESFYQSKKYAAALQAFNGNMDISRMQEVEVPPLHELQKMTGVPARNTEPTGGGRTVIPARGMTPAEPPVRGPVVEPTGNAGESLDWGPAGKRRSVVKYERFSTPKDGMTPREVAKAVYADENEWPRLIGPRGAKLRADDRLPQGTELTVPREELPWK